MRVAPNAPLSITSFAQPVACGARLRMQNNRDGAGPIASHIPCKILHLNKSTAAPSSPLRIMGIPSSILDSPFPSVESTAGYQARELAGKKNNHRGETKKKNKRGF